MAHEFPGSDWGDWLPRAVADATPDGVDLWYLGCNGFILKASDGTTLFIDPYCGTATRHGRDGLFRSRSTRTT